MPQPAHMGSERTLVGYVRSSHYLKYFICLEESATLAIEQPQNIAFRLGQMNVHSGASDGERVKIDRKLAYLRVPQARRARLESGRPFKRTAYACEKFSLTRSFGYVVIRTKAKSAHLVRLALKRSKEYYRHKWIFGPYLATNIEARCPRHHDIQQNKIGTSCAKHLKTLKSAARQPDGISACGQQSFDSDSNGSFVVYYENLSHDSLK